VAGTRRMRQTARVIAIDRRSISRFVTRFEGANLREQPLFPRLILKERLTKPSNVILVCEVA
jgi:hypothetical protein